MFRGFVPILGGNTVDCMEISMISLYFSFVWRIGLAWFFLRVGLYFCICPIFRAISIGLTCRLVCISGFFTCGCYLVIGRILLVVVS